MISFAVLVLTQVFAEGVLGKSCFELQSRQTTESRKEGALDYTVLQQASLRESLNAIESVLLEGKLSAQEAANSIPILINPKPSKASGAAVGISYSESSAKAWERVRIKPDGTQVEQISNILDAFERLAQFASKADDKNLQLWLITASDALFQAIRSHDRSRTRLSEKAIDAIAELYEWQRQNFFGLELFYTRPERSLGIVKFPSSRANELGAKRTPAFVFEVKKVPAFADVLEERVIRLLALPANTKEILALVEKEYEWRSSAEFQANKSKVAFNRHSSGEVELSAVVAAASRLDHSLNEMISGFWNPSLSQLKRNALLVNFELELHLALEVMRLALKKIYLTPSFQRLSMSPLFRYSVEVLISVFEYVKSDSVRLELVSDRIQDLMQEHSDALKSLVEKRAISFLQMLIIVETTYFSETSAKFPFGGLWESVLLQAPQNLIEFFIRQVGEMVHPSKNELEMMRVFQSEFENPLALARQNYIAQKMLYPIGRYPLHALLALNPFPFEAADFLGILRVATKEKFEAALTGSEKPFLLALIWRYTLYPELAVELKNFKPGSVTRERFMALLPKTEFQDLGRKSLTGHPVVWLQNLTIDKASLGNFVSSTPASITHRHFLNRAYTAFNMTAETYWDESKGRVYQNYLSEPYFLLSDLVNRQQSPSVDALRALVEFLNSPE